MENRRVQRSNVGSEVQICVGEEVFMIGEFQDFSRIGARIQAPCYVKPKTFIKIGYKDHTQAAHLVHCAVIWVRTVKKGPNFELGLQFIAY